MSTPTPSVGFDATAKAIAAGRTKAAIALEIAKSLGMQIPKLTTCGTEILSELEFAGGTVEAKIYPPSALRTLLESKCISVEWGVLHRGQSEAKLASMTCFGLAALEAHRSAKATPSDTHEVAK